MTVVPEGPHTLATQAAPVDLAYGGASPDLDGQPSPALLPPRRGRLRRRRRSTVVTATTKTITVTVSGLTTYSKTEMAKASSLRIGECATAYGSTNDIGTLTAARLTVTQATGIGCPAFGGFGPAGEFSVGGSTGAPGAGVGGST
jgi:hypothetical protein